MIINTTQISEMDDAQTRETYRRIMVDALTAKAERYRGEARTMHAVATEKNNKTLLDQVQENLNLAAYADRLAVAIKEA